MLLPFLAYSTAQEEVQKMMASSPVPSPNGAVDGFRALAQVIGKEQIANLLERSPDIVEKFKTVFQKKSAAEKAAEADE